MRCGCPKCGEYMAQNEQGLNSKCVCPACFNECDACMGKNAIVIPKDRLNEYLSKYYEQDGVDDR